jgi:hypothetical protein
LINGEMLKTIDFGGIGDEEQRAQLAFRDGVVGGLLFAKIEELAELADFFVESHLFEESVCALTDCRVIERSSRGGSLRKRERNDSEREDKEQNI